jgi:UDP-N-acetylglucosamine--N-acetylmuramyl-(pentapeptide) pyrophosphoryl-undecaprenol N-acetylglucosamine transferase
MRILAVGGGSGGHVTPVVAVLKEIRARHPRAELRFWCDHSFYVQARATIDIFDADLPVHRIIAGKLRRYHHLSLWQQLTWPALMLANIRDFFFVIIGVFQSLIKLIIWRPDVVFTKGGFVCLPVGFAAHLLRIPLVIHDSDAHPGLTNRILSRWADVIATGAPLEYYNYDASKSVYVGIPINSAFRPYSRGDQREAKVKWGVSPDDPLVVVTGGGLGAQRINYSVVEHLSKFKELGTTILVSGADNYEEIKEMTPESAESFFQVYPFVTDMPSLLGAADVVVTRAGATTILELAALKKPTILIPNGKLTGGHQLKNAAVYQEKDALKIVDEDTLERSPKELVKAIQSLLFQTKETEKMAARLHDFARPNAAKDMAELITKAAGR